MDENPYASPQDLDAASASPQGFEGEFQPVEVHYRWTIDEYLTAIKYYQRQKIRPSIRWALNVVLSLMTVMFGILAYRRPHLIRFLFVLLFCLVLLRDLLIRIYLVHKFKSDLHKDSEVTCVFTEEHIANSSKLVDGHIKWEGIVKWCETPSGFLAYLHTILFLWTPLSGFHSEEDIDTVRELAQRKLGEDKCRIVK